MSEANKAVIRRFYEELDKGNYDVYSALCSDDYVFSAMRYYRMAGGKIAEEWACFDQLALLQQLGAGNAPGEGDE